MKTFRTSDKAEWQLSLTVSAAKRAKDLAKIDLLALEQGDPPLLSRLGTELMLVCEAVYAIVQPQAKERNLDAEQFGELFDSAVIQAAVAAFWEELIDFFLKLGRTDTVTAIRAQMKVVELTVAGVDARLEAIDLESLVSQALGSSSTKLPDSSQLTPAP